MRGCVQPSGFGGRGRSFPKDKLGSLRETMLCSSSPVSQVAQWICWLRNYLLQVIQRDGGALLNQRMLPQVIRILYVLSFCFFQGGFIRWDALTCFSVYVRVVFSVSLKLLVSTLLHRVCRLPHFKTSAVEEAPWRRTVRAKRFIVGVAEMFRVTFN